MRPRAPRSRRRFRRRSHSFTTTSTSFLCRMATVSQCACDAMTDFARHERDLAVLTTTLAHATVRQGKVRDSAPPAATHRRAERPAHSKSDGVGGGGRAAYLVLRVAAARDVRARTAMQYRRPRGCGHTTPPHHSRRLLKEFYRITRHRLAHWTQPHSLKFRGGKAAHLLTVRLARAPRPSKDDACARVRARLRERRAHARREPRDRFSVVARGRRPRALVDRRHRRRDARCDAAVEQRGGGAAAVRGARRRCVWFGL